jgi:hypothetical protein
VTNVSAVDASTARTGAIVSKAPLILPVGTVIHMIAFAGHDEACEFVDKMAKYANRRGDRIACTTIVTTGEDFTWAAQAQVPVMLISAHGPASELHEPVIGDGKGNRIRLRSLGQTEPFAFGARDGIAWDACYTGQPGFRSELPRLCAPGVAHVAPIRKIRWRNSVHMVRKVIAELVAPGCPPVTATSFAAAAAKATASSRIKLWHGAISGEDMS